MIGIHLKQPCEHRVKPLLIFVACVVVAVLASCTISPNSRVSKIAACDSKYKDKTPAPVELTEVLHQHSVWFDRGRVTNPTTTTHDDSGRANLCNVDLKWTDLSGANLKMADLRGADLRWANLSGVDFWMANLEGADLRHVNLSKAKLSRANLRGAIYEPNAGSVPDVQGMAEAVNLAEVVWINEANGLVELQQAFKSSGFREQERQVTYARKRSEFSPRVPDLLYSYDWQDGSLRGGSMPGTPNPIEATFNYLFFDLTSQYGMSPGRPLRILATLIPLFALLYIPAVRRKVGGGIWLIWPDPKDRVPRDDGANEPVRIVQRGFKGVTTALYFSLLSAFNIGWREINVGNWIARIQAREYSLRGTGWVRTAAGIQSLISVYLVALWILTYFGRPFE